MKKILVVAPCNYGPENYDGVKKILHNVFCKNTHWLVDYVHFHDVDNYDQLANVKPFLVEQEKTNFYNYFRYPAAIRHYDLKSMQIQVVELVSRKKYDAIVVVTGVLASIISVLDKEARNKSYLLAIDSMPLFWSRNARTDNIVTRLKSIWQQFAWKNFEKKYYTQYRRVIFVSKLDTELYMEYTGCQQGCTIENGIDTDSFRCIEYKKGNNVIFSGNMSYEPNREAIRYFIKEIYPYLCCKCPSVQIYIVGRNAESLKKYLPSSFNINIVSDVKDMGEALSWAKVYVSPLLHGAGIKNKILEALSAGKAIVGSAISFDGIDLDKEFCKCVAIANDADTYIENILSFLKLDDDFVMKCGNAMHEYVASKYSWKLVADKYDSVIE